MGAEGGSVVSAVLKFFWENRDDLLEYIRGYLRGGKCYAFGPHKSFNNLEEAAKDIREECKKAKSIKILACKGDEFLFRDTSIVSTNKVDQHNNLEELIVLVLDEEGAWTPKYVAIYRDAEESIERYKKQLIDSHARVLEGFNIYKSQLELVRKSGVYVYNSDPCFRVIMTDKVAYVSNYANSITPDNSRSKQIKQACELPVLKFYKRDGSQYTAFKRHFSNLFNNHSLVLEEGNKKRPFRKGAGGILYTELDGHVYIALMQRDEDDGYVFAKGKRKRKHKETMEENAIRECKEEFTLDESKLEIELYLGQYADYSHEPKVYDFFKIRYHGSIDDPLKTEAGVHHSPAWYKIEDVPKLHYKNQRIMFDLFKRKYR